MKRALYAYKITGIKTSIPFLSRIMSVPDFVKGRYNTHFIQDNQQYLELKDNASEKIKDVVAITAFVDFLTKVDSASSVSSNGSIASNWKTCGRIRSLNRL